MASMNSFSLVSTDSIDQGPPSSSLPPFRVQGRLLSDPLADVQEDIWEYAISEVWLAQWISLASPKGCRTSSTPTTSKGSLMSSFESSAMLENDSPCNSLGPIAVCEMDVENKYISESSWTILYAWYGVDSLSLVRRRHRNPLYNPLSSDGSHNVLADKFLDILMVHLCPITELGQPDKHTIVQLYAWDTVQFWNEQFKHKLGIPSSSSSNLWLITEHNGLEKCEKVSGLSQTSFLQIICDQFPKLIQFMTNRQNMYPAQELYLSFSSHQAPSYKRPDQSLPSDDATKSYLFQEMLLMDYKITVAVECLIDDFVSLSLTPNVSRGAPCLTEEFVKVGNSSEWEIQLEQILDNVSIDMKNLIDTNKEKVKDICTKVIKTMKTETDALNTSLEAKITQNLNQEKQLAAREQDIIEKETFLNEKMERFKVGLADFLVQKKQLEEELKKIKTLNKIADSKVKINVGGHIFETSRETLGKEPNSLLGVMFSGKHSLTQDQDGSYFIDRDGTHFRFILNFLRDGSGSFSSMPCETTTLREILKEAKYYNLVELMDFIKHKIGD